MKLSNATLRLSLLLFLALATFLHTGCSQEASLSPVGPSHTLAPSLGSSSTTEEEDHDDDENGGSGGQEQGGGEEEDDDDYDFLTVAQRDPAQDGVSTAVIGPDGGVLPHADHRLEVPAGALDAPLELSFSVPVSDTLTFDMGPHGTQFNLPVSLVFDYSDADLTGVNEALLQVYYYDPSTQIFEAIPTQVDSVNKVIIGYTDHFSRYAIIRK